MTDRAGKFRDFIIAINLKHFLPEYTDEKRESKTLDGFFPDFVLNYKVASKLNSNAFRFEISNFTRI